MRRPSLPSHNHAGTTAFLMQEIQAAVTSSILQEIQACPTSAMPLHRASQIRSAIPTLEGTCPCAQALRGVTKGPLSVEQEIFIENSAHVRETDPTFYGTIVLMAQSVMGYEREMQRLERRVRELQGQIEVLDAVKRFDTGGREMRVVSASASANAEDWGGDVKETKDEIEKEERAKGLVDMTEWPLPPRRKAWVMVQGERKRKRQLK